MRLRSLFYLLMTGLATLVAIAWLVVVKGTYDKFTSALQARASLAALSDSLILAQKLASERNDHATLLMSQLAIDEQESARLLAQRSDSIHALEQTRQSILRAPYLGFEDELRQLDDIRSALQRLHEGVQVQLATSPDHRDRGAIGGYMMRMVQLSTTVGQLSGRIDQAVTRADPVIGQISSIARLCSMVRDIADQRAIAALAFIDPRLNWEGDARRIGELGGRVEQMWDRVRQLIALTSDSVELRPAAEAVEVDYFVPAGNAYAELISNHGSRQTPTETVDGRRWPAPAVQSLINMRDRAVSLAEWRVSRELHSAQWTLATASAGAAVALLLGFLGAFVFARRVLYPILDLTGVITRLAKNERHLLVPAIQRNDEIGQMARAIETLRLSAIASDEREALDTAERDTRERELRIAKGQAEAANRAKSVFLANMSHELRTPLNAIIGFSDIMRSQLFGSLSSKYRDYAQDIFSSGSHLLQLINRVLDLAKVESGTAELVEGMVDLRDVTGRVINVIRVQADAANIAVQSGFPDELPALWGDEVRIQEILTNLLNNAVKFTPKGGRIVVGAKLCNDGQLSIFVADNGIGIAAEDIPLVTQPFVQVGRPLRQSDGTGLGLPLTKQIAEMHGGEMHIYSEIGIGTTVSVVFPKSRVRQQRQLKTGTGL